MRALNARMGENKSNEVDVIDNDDRLLYTFVEIGAKEDIVPLCKLLIDNEFRNNEEVQSFLYSA